MQIDINSAEFCLDDKRPMTLRSARGLHIACTAGTLWITVAGDAEDIFLAAGQDYRLRQQGLTLIEGIGPARLRLDGAPARCAIALG